MTFSAPFTREAHRTRWIFYKWSWSRRRFQRSRLFPSWRILYLLWVPQNTERRFNYVLKSQRKTAFCYTHERGFAEDSTRTALERLWIHCSEAFSLSTRSFFPYINVASPVSKWHPPLDVTFWPVYQVKMLDVLSPFLRPGHVSIGIISHTRLEQWLFRVGWKLQ